MQLDDQQHLPMKLDIDLFHDIWGLTWSCEQVCIGGAKIAWQICVHLYLTQGGKGWLQRIEPLWTTTRPNPYLDRPAWVHEKNTQKKVGVEEKGGGLGPLWSAGNSILVDQPSVSQGPPPQLSDPT